jgi:peptidyl-prolyl cis-trans isomerase SurA
MRLSLLVFLIVGLYSSAYAQSTTTHADRVIAVVGDYIILQSEVEVQYQQQVQASQGSAVDSDLHAHILDNLLLDRLFLAQAALDSVVVSTDEVEGELERRVKYFLGVFGSKEKMEEYYGKSVAEMKEDFREDIRNQLTSDKPKSSAASRLVPKKLKIFLQKYPKTAYPISTQS